MNEREDKSTTALASLPWSRKPRFLKAQPSRFLAFIGFT